MDHKVHSVLHQAEERSPLNESSTKSVNHGCFLHCLLNILLVVEKEEVRPMGLDVFVEVRRVFRLIGLASLHLGLISN